MFHLPRRSNRCLFVQWTPPHCQYLLAERSSPAPRIEAVGRCQHVEDRPLAEHLAAELAERGIRCRQVVLLLPRGELEMSSHQVPPATVDELPQLVRSAVASELDDPPGTHISDFLVTHQCESGGEALAFSMRQTDIQQYREQFASVGMSLQSITFCGLGGVEYLRQVVRRPATTAAILVVGDHGIDLAVTENGCPAVFRWIPCSTQPSSIRPEWLSGEIRRTLASAHNGSDDATRLYLIGDVGQYEQLAHALSEQLNVTASVVNPLEDVELEADVTAPSRYANLLGIAYAWNGPGLELDLVNARRAPLPVARWRRVACWGGVVLAASLVIAIVSWQNRAEQLDELAQQRQKLKQLGTRANKAMEIEDTVQAVHNWRSDDIVWLDELRSLSQRLPDGGAALVRRMNMTTGAQGTGVIDVAVQVSQPEVVANLEDAVRDERHSVSSKRVTESDDQAELPWAFETRILFQPAEPAELWRDDDQTAAGEDDQHRATEVRATETSDVQESRLPE